MTREEAAQSIYGLILSAEDEDGPCIFSDQIEALEMGIEALKQIRAIEGIIDVSNTIIQEDVLKYKMIVDVVKGEW